jgi:hypothetical protein
MSSQRVEESIEVVSAYSELGFRSLPCALCLLIIFFSFLLGSSLVLDEDINVVPLSEEDDTTALGFPCKDFLFSHRPLFLYLKPETFVPPPDLAASRTSNSKFIARLADQISVAGFGGSVISGVSLVDAATYQKVCELKALESYTDLSQLLIDKGFVTNFDGVNRVFATQVLNWLWGIHFNSLQAKIKKGVVEISSSILKSLEDFKGSSINFGNLKKMPAHLDFEMLPEFKNITLFEKTRSTYSTLPCLIFFYNIEKFTEGPDFKFLSGIAKVGSTRNLNSNVVQSFDIFNLIETHLRKPMILISRELYRVSDPRRDNFYFDDFVLDLSKVKFLN